MDTSQWPRYTDGSLVIEGDSVRYHQAPGGILPASMEWRNGTAVTSKRFGFDSLVLESQGRKYNLFGHVIERVETEGE